MLRFAFMDGNVPRSAAIRFLEQFERELGVYVGELRAKFDRDTCQSPTHTGMLAFAAGVLGMEAQVEWVRMALARLKESAA